MAQQMTKEQRLQILETYNPSDHLIEVAKDKERKAVMYYPAAWRLYELNLRYENANFKSEILHINPEKDFVIVKAYLYLGKDYETSEKKAEAMKQGRISNLDKVETAAKARAARDFGIGTEYALDMDEADDTNVTNVQVKTTSTKTHQNPIPKAVETVKSQASKEASQRQADPPSVKNLYDQGRLKKIWNDQKGFYEYVSKQLKTPIDAKTPLSPEQRLQLIAAINAA